MFSVEVRCWSKCDEELRSIRVWSGIRHAQDSCASMFQCWMDFISELLSTSQRNWETTNPYMDWPPRPVPVLHSAIHISGHTDHLLESWNLVLFGETRVSKDLKRMYNNSVVISSFRLWSARQKQDLPTRQSFCTSSERGHSTSRTQSSPSSSPVLHPPCLRQQTFNITISAQICFETLTH